MKKKPYFFHTLNFSCVLKKRIERGEVLRSIFIQAKAARQENIQKTVYGYVCQAMFVRK